MQLTTKVATGIKPYREEENLKRINISLKYYISSVLLLRRYLYVLVTLAHKPKKSD
jgi:hypothetical protein